MQSRSGMTKLELLVVFVVLALVVSLVPMAVLTARDASRRTQCAGNLRQLGVALTSYHSSFGVLPPAGVWKAGPADDIDKLHQAADIARVTHANWVGLLVPHLGEDAPSTRLDGSRPIGDPQNTEFRTAEFALMKCPGDRFNRIDNPYRLFSQKYGEVSFARGSYAINGGTHRFAAMPGTSADPVANGFQYVADHETREVQYWGGGVAGFNKSFSFDDFTNGLSTTVTVEEIRAGLHFVDPRGVWSLGQIGGSVTGSHGMNGDAGRPNDTRKLADDVTGCATLHEIFGEEGLVNEGMPCCSYCPYNDQAAARSLHPGGVHALMADGAVHFVADEVDPGLWHVMHSRETPQEILAGGLQELLAGSLPSSSRTAVSDSSAAKHVYRQADVVQLPGTFSNSIGMQFVLIPAGEFEMDLPDESIDAIIPLETPPEPHRVRITRPFCMGTFEVTQQQFELVMNTNPSWHGAHDRDRHVAGVRETSQFPVENITWEAAHEFCRRLSGLPAEKMSGRTYRLPTEAEWEYACRAGKSTPYVYIPQRQPHDDSGENAMREPPLPITPVGSYRPNPFGLHDMRGNVWEWCSDWFSRDDAARPPANDPVGPDFGYLRVVRGSDWTYTGDECRLGFHSTEPWRRNRFIGFRVVCEIRGKTSD